MKDESYGSTLLSVKIEKNKTKVIIWYMSYIPILVAYVLQLFVRNNFFFLCKDGTAAPQLVNLNFQWSYSSAAT